MRRYDLVAGDDLTPSIILVDARGDLFAEVSASFIIVRKGYEAESERLAGDSRFVGDAATTKIREGSRAPLHYAGTNPER